MLVVIFPMLDLGSGMTIDLLEPIASLEVMEGSEVFPP